MTTIDVRPVMRCLWLVVGKPVCAKPASHGTLIGETTFYLCPTHARRAKAEGWRGVQPLRPA